MHRLTAPLAVAALLALTAGCGEQDSGGATPTSTPTTAPTTPPSEGKEKIRVVGQVAEIGDCVVVRDDNEIT